MYAVDQHFDLMAPVLGLQLYQPGYGGKFNSGNEAYAVSMQLGPPLTPTLSPSDGEREKFCGRGVESLNRDYSSVGKKRSLAPSDGERVRVRGRLD
jgi:hypothetical protein